MKKLLITLHNAQICPNSPQRGTVRYERYFSSLEEFVAEYTEQYNLIYGTDGWSVEVAP